MQRDPTDGSARGHPADAATETTGAPSTSPDGSCVPDPYAKRPDSHGAPDHEPHVPAWLRETGTALLTNPQLLLYGNIRDSYLVPAGSTWRTPDIREAVWWLLRPLGYDCLLIVDPIDGLTALPNEDTPRESVARLAGGSLGTGRPLGLETLLRVLRAVAGSTDARVAVMVDYASRLIRDVHQLGPEEHYFFAACEKLSHTARVLRLPAGNDATPLYNPVIWVTNHDRDLPSWFTADTAAIRRIAIPLPDLGDRKVAAELLASGLVDPASSGAQREEAAYRFAEQTQTLTLRSMMEIVRLARTQSTIVQSIEDATRCYRVGILDNPWSKPFLRDRLATATRRLETRVRGQEEAIGRSLDIIVRSVMGLSGAQTSSVAARPRGTLFFAGPTGVGKTELAKALTELIFGDESAYIRFDMSEFAAEHAAERLIGAPPGYVGHDAGGELTNAVRERPFSLILFDEIEKAHPRILDKFLQILDDGRLTDGTGSTVYFSEAVLVFTSNLGMTRQDERGRSVIVATPETSRDELVSVVTSGIRQHITEVLNRPELLNRLGDNIVVFNFVGRAAAEEIFDLQVRRITDLVEKELHVRVEIAADVREVLRAVATADLSLGGRGIGSLLETALVNPLARTLFTQGANPAPRQTVVAIACDDSRWRVTLR
ncbi:AAA family ATPase [Embleya sp. NPDC059237]|uniref:AAA family ATPase n=1 Tax=Embleya sp. NPDC059237 TaxID=3346784 RepID=UPI0036CA47F2